MSNYFNEKIYQDLIRSMADDLIENDWVNKDEQEYADMFHDYEVACLNSDNIWVVLRHFYNGKEEDIDLYNAIDDFEEDVVKMVEKMSREF